MALGRADLSLDQCEELRSPEDKGHPRPKRAAGQKLTSPFPPVCLGQVSNGDQAWPPPHSGENQDFKTCGVGRQVMATHLPLTTAFGRGPGSMTRPSDVDALAPITQVSPE